MFCVGSVLLLGGYAFTGVAQEAISTFPYVENFDDAEDYETLPAGWTTVATGAMKFSVGRTIDFGPGETAQTGTQFLGTSSYFDSNREDVAFSPMFEMTAGTEYTMTVWVKSPGTTTNRYPTVKITAGQGQTKEVQTTVLAERAEVFADWTELTYIFTPEANGQYSFGLWYVAAWSSAGNLFYDSFSVTAAATPQTPEVITTFPYTENFDEASEGGMPTGWTAVGVYTFTVQPYYNYGVDPAQSGNQFIVSGAPQMSSRQDIAFSPMFEMTAGTEYTMTVWMKMPGIGNSRNPGMKITAGLAPIAEAHGEDIGVVLVERHEVVASWEKVECKFTPETDGQYCFGLWNCSVLSSAGDVFYDSFSVTTANGSGEEGWQATLPYLETFDDATHYSGEDYLPIGWLATGDETFVTANITGKPAVSGEYYIVARDYIASNRQEIAYSPLLEMEQGTEYQVSLYLYMPGNVSDPSFKLTVGNAQESAAHATVLREVADTRLADWTRVDATFTPEADGPYCFGLWAVSKESNGGHITLCGKDITHASIRERSKDGMSHIPEDRHKHGLILDYTLENNMVLQRYWQPEFQNHGFIRKDKVREYSDRLIGQYDVRSGQGSVTIARSMSGGNQQKAIIAREIDRDPKLLVAVQPTRGLDVGAIEYIHRQIVAQRDAGKAVLLVSLELDEVMNLSDRILVMYEGEVVGEFDPKTTTVQELGLYMAGARKQGKGE